LNNHISQLYATPIDLTTSQQTVAFTPAPTRPPLTPAMADNRRNGKRWRDADDYPAYSRRSNRRSVPQWDIWARCDDQALYEEEGSSSGGGGGSGESSRGREWYGSGYERRTRSYENGRMGEPMHVLMVAEKPQMARAIAEALAQGGAGSVEEQKSELALP